MGQWWDGQKELLLLTPAEIDDLPEGTALGCIDGRTYTLGTDYIDMDTRGGLTAYGVRAGHPLYQEKELQDIAERVMKLKDALRPMGVLDPSKAKLGEETRKDEEHRASKWASGT